MLVITDKVSNRKHNLIMDVVSFCYMKLIPSYDININISIRNTKDKDLKGWCQHNFDDEYEIRVHNKLSIKELVTTLCHEMVHIKQRVKGELVNDMTWRGKKYTEEQPWEVEAYAMESILFQEYYRNIKNG